MKSILITALLILACGWAKAQALNASAPALESPPAARTTTVATASSEHPKVGLVLEGGGALGLAHVGVIRWLEEHHIEVDYVAGTSMGGLVGGMYASGESPSQLRKIVAETNWDDVLRGQTPFRELSFRRKEDRSDYPNRFEFGLKNGPQFPSGFNAGHQVGLILDRIALPYGNLKSFNELPIPFRCVATDLKTGQGKVFSSGSLTEALRATMSLPGFFSPVRRNGTVYVDGGMVNNLPVDVARNMGADIVIAVHLRTTPYDAREPISSVGVLTRSIKVLIEVNEMRSIEQADIVITVDVSGYTINDYKQYEVLEQAGYNAAAAKAKVLVALRSDDDSYAGYLAQRKSRIAKVPVPQFVTVVGADPDVAAGLEYQLRDQVGKPLNIPEINERMTAITGEGRFDRAGYHIVERNGRFGLEVNADEKEYAPPTVNPLLLIDGTNYQKALFSVGARFTLPDLGGFGSEFRADVIAGSQYGISAEYFHPIARNSNWFVLPHVEAESLPFDIYLNDNVVAEYRQRRLDAGADFGYQFGRVAQLQLGYTAGYLHLSRQIGLPQFSDLTGRTGVTALRYTVDNVDDPVIPRQGQRFRGSLQWVDANPGARNGYPVGTGDLSLFQRISEPASLFFSVEGGSTFGRSNSGLPAFSLGGPLRLGSFGSNEILTNQYYLLQPGYIRRIKQLSPLLGKATYLLTSLEYARVYDNLGQDRTARDVNFGILVETIFGPITFGGSIGDSNHRKFYFKVGRFF